MKLDKNICLGGRFNRKEILGIRINGHDIYQYNINTYIKGEFKNNTDIIEVYTLVTSNHTDLSWMFSGCINLKTINGMDEWDTSKVTTMNSMFYSCSSLTALDLNSFNTSKVTNMEFMFSNCANLTSLNLSNFDTSNVTNMDSMFHNCSSLTELDLSSFDTSKVYNMMAMFSQCKNLTSLNMNNCDVSNVIYIIDMLKNCSSLVNFQAPKNISTDFNVQSCIALSHDSLMSIINNLATVTGKTLTLSSTNFTELSEEEKAIATNKGWTLEFK